MRLNKTRQLMFAALCVALGILLPFLFHSIPNAGSIFLPMHIPVLLSGFVCTWPFSLAVGLITPILSSLMTGMPPAAILPGMALELAVYGLMSGVLFQVVRTGRLAVRVYVTLIGAMLCGRVVAGVVNALIFQAGDYSLQVWLTGMFVTGLPGILIQLTILPALAAALTRVAGVGAPARAEAAGDDPLFTRAKAMLQGGEASCVVIQDGKIVHTADGRGVSPILGLYGEKPELMEGAFVVDKLIGKAAAMVLVLAGVSRVYGETVSEAGRAYLRSHGVTVEWGRCIDVIANRDRTGICPLENAVLALEDPRAGYEKLKETVQALNKSAG